MGEVDQRALSGVKGCKRAGPRDAVVGKGFLQEWSLIDSVSLALLCIVAAVVRAACFTGFMGSDEVTYTEQAIRVLNWDWRPSNYVGSIRYGINVPVAGFLGLFGISEWTGNLWGYLCSVLEVMLVYVAGHAVWGRRAAIFSAGLMVFLPLHVHYAGRLMGDAPLAMFITLSFLLLVIAEAKGFRSLFFVAGVACGTVFWIKEVAFIYFACFVVYAIFKWPLLWKWACFASGAFLMVVLNCLLMFWISGDPLHVFRVMGKYVETVQRIEAESSLGFYFWYLLVDLRHTWLLGYLAAWGGIAWILAVLRGGWRVAGRAGFVIFWGVSLVGLFSFAVISLKPLSFIAKQTNYMLIFCAPLCLAGGYCLACARGRIGLVVALLYVGGASILCGLEQQAVNVFTANSFPTVKFAKGRADAEVFCMTNAYRAARYADLMEGKCDNPRSLKLLSELFEGDAGSAGGPVVLGEAGGRYAVVDLANAGWGGNRITRLSEVPGSWRLVGELEPTRWKWAGRASVLVVRGVMGVLPGFVSERLAPVVNAISVQPCAYVYEVPSDFRFVGD